MGRTEAALSGARILAPGRSRCRRGSSSDRTCLHCSNKVAHAHRSGATAILAFVRDGGIRLVSQVIEDQWPGKSKTTLLLTYAPVVGAIMWTVTIVFLVILAF
jgi:hypothetical protein